jgi:hypothetical protein
MHKLSAEKQWASYLLAARLGGFAQSLSPDWAKEKSLRVLCVSNERSEWVVKMPFL